MIAEVVTDDGSNDRDNGESDDISGGHGGSLIPDIASIIWGQLSRVLASWRFVTVTLGILCGWRRSSVCVRV